MNEIKRANGECMCVVLCDDDGYGRESVVKSQCCGPRNSTDWRSFRTNLSLCVQDRAGSDMNEATALHLACMAGSAEIVEILLASGADVDAVTVRPCIYTTTCHSSAFRRLHFFS
jgi:hypothetical protein